MFQITTCDFALWCYRGDFGNSIIPFFIFLFVSGFTQNVIFQDGVIDAGVEFLQKPYKLFDLAQKVHNMLATRPASRA
ncbi:MAG: hypothetical protein LAN84_11675 [Acidobacteriia bacterium]|nr:hypothetical protein [Terriglobia bacterium]